MRRARGPGGGGAGKGCCSRRLELVSPREGQRLGLAGARTALLSLRQDRHHVAPLPHLPRVAPGEAVPALTPAPGWFLAGEGGPRARAPPWHRVPCQHPPGAHPRRCHPRASPVAARCPHMCRPLPLTPAAPPPPFPASPEPPASPPNPHRLGVPGGFAPARRESPALRLPLSRPHWHAPVLRAPTGEPPGQRSCLGQ